MLQYLSGYWDKHLTIVCKIWPPSARPASCNQCCHHPSWLNSYWGCLHFCYCVYYYSLFVCFSIYFDLLYCYNWTFNSVRTTGILKSNWGRGRGEWIKKKFLCLTQYENTSKKENLVLKSDRHNGNKKLRLINIFSRMFLYQKIVNLLRKEIVPRSRSQVAVKNFV